jgi:simple sugar transport system substrate-binding protein
MNKLFLRSILIVMSVFIIITIAGCAEEVAPSEEVTEEVPEEEFEIVVIVKLEHPWFDDMQIGIEEAAEELGVNAYMVAPAEADAAQQVALIESHIAKGVDAICVVPNDPAAIEPVLGKAQDAGIITITHESTSAENVSYDVEAFDNHYMGERCIDNIIKFSEGKVKNYAFMVGSLTAETHMERFNGAKEYQLENHPELNLLTDPPLVSEENTQVAYEKTIELISKYGDELHAIIFSSAASPMGVGNAIEEKGLVGKIVSVGGGVPSAAKEYIVNGSVHAVTGWRPADAGYVQVWLAKQLLDGKEIKEGQDFPKWGKITIKGKVIYGGESGCLDWSKENLEDFVF